MLLDVFAYRKNKQDGSFEVQRERTIQFPQYA